MSNVIKYWKNEKKKKKNDGRMNENNRQSMPILRKKVVSLQSELKKEQFKDEKERSITNKKQNIYESNDYQRQRRPRGGES